MRASSDLITLEDAKIILGDESTITLEQTDFEFLDLNFVPGEERLILLTDFYNCIAEILQESQVKPGVWIIVAVYHPDFVRVNKWHHDKNERN